MHITKIVTIKYIFAHFEETRHRKRVNYEVNVHFHINDLGERVPIL